jgi:hypothetical protein
MLAKHASVRLFIIKYSNETAYDLLDFKMQLQNENAKTK